MHQELNPYLHRGRSQVIGVQDMRLEDIPKQGLKHLALLLRIDSVAMRGHGPGNQWLHMQEDDLRLLPPYLSRTANPFVRVTLNLGYHGFPFAPNCANLCGSHHDLEPRVIRNMMVLVAREWTKHVELYRYWRTKLGFHKDVVTWLDRMDTALATWIGSSRFKDIYGYDAHEQPAYYIKSRCEACMLAVVGGKAELLSDIRASLYVRKILALEKRGQSLTPRLMRTVDEWIGHFEESTRHHILSGSDRLVTRILDQRNYIYTQDNPEDAKLRDADKAAHRKRYPLVMANSSPHQTQPVSTPTSPASESRPRSGSARPSPPIRVPKSLMFCGFRSTHNDNDASEASKKQIFKWLEQQKSVSTAELTALGISRAAYSEFAAASAVPLPLHLQEEGEEEQGHGDATRDDEVGSWISASVYSYDEGKEDVLEVRPTQQPPGPSTPLPPQTPPSPSIYAMNPELPEELSVATDALPLASQGQLKRQTDFFTPRRAPPPRPPRSPEFLEWI
ncbi:hypothetical protein S40293_01880 [Stachybotrys chartarum IBT 40293]|nr:hypothetical protein S40293_01880 [Stachybotrys chartarum IBT 40293]